MDYCNATFNEAEGLKSDDESLELLFDLDQDGDTQDIANNN